jgi:glycosyltransferase involved in cell wall biosynthesis
MAPKVSVVIPVFNRPAAVRRAIDSVLAQTCQEFEVIVVDDGSTDDTPAAVLAVSDPRITLMRHAENRGGSAARNTGIRASNGSFVAFLDSDDEWLPTKLERQLESFERSGGALALVYTGTEHVNADGTFSRQIPRRHVNLARMLLVKNVVGETSVGMVRRTALLTVGGFDESLPACQDVDLWQRISRQFNAIGIPEALVRVSKGNDGDRISAGLHRTLLGREMYCRKHKEEMIRHGVLHLWLRETGWWQQRRAKNVRLARGLYRESLDAHALAPFTVLLFLVSWIPLSWLDHVARCRHTIVRTLKGQPRDTLNGQASQSRFIRNA